MLIAGADSNNYEVYVLYRRGKAGQDKVGNTRGHQGWAHLAQDILAATVITFFFGCTQTCCYGTNTCHCYLASSK